MDLIKLGTDLMNGHFDQADQEAVVAAIGSMLASSGSGSGRTGSSGGLDLGSIISAMKEHGFGEILESWLGQGSNNPITTNQLRQVLGNDRVTDMSTKLATPEDNLLDQLIQVLPALIDQYSNTHQV